MIGLKLILSIKLIEQKEIAKQLGVVPQSVSDWMLKKRKIPSKRLEQLEVLFGIKGNLIQGDLTEENKARINYHYGIMYNRPRSQRGNLKEYCQECDDLTEFKIGKVYEDIFEATCTSCDTEYEWWTREYERVLRDVVKKIV